MIYLMDRVPGEKDVLKVIDFKTGKVLKEAGIESAGRVNFPGSRSVPTVTADRVYASGPMGVVAAWKRDDLSLLWSVDLAKEFGAKPLHFGYPIHPQVHGDLVIISANSNEASVIALKSDTGELAWKTGGLYGSLSSPIVQKFQGRDQVFYISQEKPETPGKGGAYSIAGLDPKSGDVLWRYEKFEANIPIPPPVVVDEQTLFVTGGYEVGSQLLKFGGGNTPEAQVTSKWGSHIVPPIVHDGHIYFLTHENATLKKKNLWPQVGLYC
ncbi:MAG: PQQ-like beta-propeller repeat protein, partial [Akkermansiaceae bacterium]|nr:PQQ-like beta-propeller repeat protein [Akkermansiaceae bacterium]